MFYDTETTGIDTNFDQILQFAAIKTDWQLNEVDRVNFRCRLLPHVIPSPAALCVTRMEIGAITDPSLPSHYEMVCAIRAKLAQWSPATFIGYNSLSFDEHLLRQAFYQCLHPLYLTNKPPNSRADALGVMQAAAALAPGTLTIPRGANGKPSFRLDQLAPANGFAHKNAHDALADVEAMIHMCRLVDQTAQHLWSNALRFSQKAAVREFAADEMVFVLSQTFFGNAYHYPVTQIGTDPDNNGTLFVADIRVDFDALKGLTDDELSARLSRSPKIVRRLRTNASPTLTQLDEGDSFDGLPVDGLRARAISIRDDQAFCDRLTALTAALQEPREESEHVEAQIYSAFFSRGDEARMEAFHKAEWSARPAIVRELEDARLRLLGKRLLYLEQPALLAAEERTRFETALARRVLGHEIGAPPWQTIDLAHKASIKMLATSSPAEQLILTQLQAYLAERSTSARRILGLG